MRFAFYGRVSTEDAQDPAASLAWQLRRANELIRGLDGTVVTKYFDLGQSRSLPWKRRPEAGRLLEDLANPAEVGRQSSSVSPPAPSMAASSTSPSRSSPTTTSRSGFPRSVGRSTPARKLTTS